jgi:hypothetical protein
MRKGAAGGTYCRKDALIQGATGVSVWHDIDVGAVPVESHANCPTCENE